MICPECGLEARVDAAWVEVSGDDAPDTPTVVERVQRLVCRDPRCARYGKQVSEARCVLYRAEGKGGENA